MDVNPQAEDRGKLTFIDSHAHLYDAQFSDDLDAVLSRALAAGISSIIVPGDRLKTSRDAVRLTIIYPNIFAAVGFHPHEAKECAAESLDEIRRMTDEPKVVAIGEIGLDYHYDNSPREIQRAIFRQHLHLAKDVDLPVIMHCREAYQDFINILDEEMSENLRGVCHCFSGEMEDAERLLKMGFHISFAGPITFPKAVKLRDIALNVPIDRMLIETDSPYLAPQPKRGKRNEPAYVVFNAGKIAELYGLNLADVARTTTRNAKLLFGLAEEHGHPVLAYELGNNLYINMTNNCTNDCAFCKRLVDPTLKGYDLRLERDPTAGEIIEQITGPSKYEEVVFCGFGEPLLNLEALKEVSRWLRANAVQHIRINTNGQGNLIHGRNIVTELIGLVDSFSISLNACDPEQYQKLCRSRFGTRAYHAVKEFIKECVKDFDVTASIVGVEGVSEKEARKIVEELGCKFRLRTYKNLL